MPAPTIPTYFGRGAARPVTGAAAATDDCVISVAGLTGAPLPCRQRRHGLGAPAAGSVWPLSADVRGRTHRWTTPCAARSMATLAGAAFAAPTVTACAFHHDRFAVGTHRRGAPPRPVGTNAPDCVARRVARPVGRAREPVRELRRSPVGPASTSTATAPAADGSASAVRARAGADARLRGAASSTRVASTASGSSDASGHASQDDATRRQQRTATVASAHPPRGPCAGGGCCHRRSRDAGAVEGVRSIASRRPGHQHADDRIDAAGLHRRDRRCRVRQDAALHLVDARSPPHRSALSEERPHAGCRGRRRRAACEADRLGQAVRAGQAARTEDRNRRRWHCGEALSVIGDCCR